MNEYLKDFSTSLANCGRLVLLSLIGISMSASPAIAGTIACNVKIASVGVTPNGTVIPAMEGVGWPYMCNLEIDHTTSAGTISPETCQGWLSMFVTASATQQSIIFYLDYGAAPAPADCQSITNFSWQVPGVFPYFFTLEK